jgi:hypothetical protein
LRLASIQTDWYINTDEKLFTRKCSVEAEKDMEHWHVGKKIRLLTIAKKDIASDRDVKRKYVSEYYNGTEGGYFSHDIEISVKDDGAIWFSEEDGTGFIYLYPEQAKHLKKILRVH